MAYSQTNSRGITYYLNGGGGVGGHKHYYFSSDERSDTGCDSVPAGYEVSENARNGMLFLRKKK